MKKIIKLKNLNHILHHPKRSNNNKSPKQNPLHQWSKPDFFNRPQTYPRPDKKQGDGQSCLSNDKQFFGIFLHLRNISAHDGCYYEKDDEQREMELLLLALKHKRRNKNQRHNPQSPRKFHGSSNSQSLITILLCRPHHRTCIMYGNSAPNSELLSRQIQIMPDRRKDEQCNGI